MALDAPPRVQSMDRVLVAEKNHLANGTFRVEAKHAECHLVLSVLGLVVPRLKLEEAIPKEEGIVAVSRTAQHVREVANLAMARGVVLGHEDGDLGFAFPEDRTGVFAQELSADVVRRAIGVESVDETTQVGPRDVVLWVVQTLPGGILHARVQHFHLAEARYSVEVGIRVRHCERDELACDSDVALRLQNGVEGRSNNLALHGSGPIKLSDLRLVYYNHASQRGVVGLTAFAIVHDKAVLQVHFVRLVNLFEAIVVGFLAAARHLQVRPIADASDHTQSIRLRLVQELCVRLRRVVAVEPDGVRAQRSHGGKVAATPRRPKHCTLC
mmetsp:Transcript_107995/g.304268  ORF Transcript_107995/g.304268 Transcript_107995/m.304268 type:complete len:327 (-) Transcript_107995:136-1116(-)